MTRIQITNPFFQLPFFNPDGIVLEMLEPLHTQGDSSFWPLWQYQQHPNPRRATGHLQWTIQHHTIHICLTYTLERQNSSILVNMFFLGGWHEKSSKRNISAKKKTIQSLGPTVLHESWAECHPRRMAIAIFIILYRGVSWRRHGSSRGGNQI